jgi:hypothetical protein
VVVRLVDVGGIVDHHCLSFLFNISGRLLISVTHEIGVRARSNVR